MPTNKKNYDLDDHAGKIYWKVIHEEKADRTFVLLYINTPAGYCATEYDFETQNIRIKSKNLREELASKKSYFLDDGVDINKRRSDLEKLYEDHEFEPLLPVTARMQTKIHVRIYKNTDAPVGLFYNHYFFPGKDHRIELVVDSLSDDVNVQDLVMKWEEPV